MLLGLSLEISAGCRLFTENEIRRERQLALIQFHNDPIVVQIPETVSVATNFEVTVRTYGGGCIDQGDTEVRIAGQAATVRPHDVFVTAMPPNYACTAELRLYTHRALLRFEQIGPAIVTVHGRVRPGDTTITVQRSVHVH